VREIRDRAANILVLMGGSDPDNVTLIVVDALKLLKYLRSMSKLSLDLLIET